MCVCVFVCTLFVIIYAFKLKCLQVFFNLVFINIYLDFLFTGAAAAIADDEDMSSLCGFVCVAACWPAKIPTKLDETKCFHLTKHRERAKRREKSDSQRGSEAAAATQQPPSQRQRAKQRR